MRTKAIKPKTHLKVRYRQKRGEKMDRMDQGGRKDVASRRSDAFLAGDDAACPLRSTIIRGSTIRTARVAAYIVDSLVQVLPRSIDTDEHFRADKLVP